ncbi:MAG TPA: phage/plasmid primase, P4 family [Allosphingosinicella sp.]|jgi:putative DNA primase/helicase|nr:phage/plasmid primase, P4 family [Allosphingosinicella sp.]
MSGDNPLLDAALAYAARGWPVFPCSPKDKRPLLPKDVDPATNKPIPNSGGLVKASTDPDQIRGWWKRWPKALIAIATGHATLDAGGLRLFVVDFDPREDKDTGEVWTLERLKTELEAQLGCEFPVTLAALTPSDGVHAYLLQGDDGPAITNRGNLPEHVDVRGLGGYVIAPPSVMGPNAIKGQAGLKYRWHRKEPVGGIARAPERLIEVLRERKTAEGGARPSGPGRPMPADLGEAEREAIRKYALSGLDLECRAVREAPSGRRNPQLNESALKIASLVASGALDETIARGSLEAAARANPGRDDDRQLIATIESGWSAGINNPRDLTEIAAAARDRASRSGSRQRLSGGSGSGSRAPPARGPARSPAGGDDQTPPFRDGRMARQSQGRGPGGDDVAPPVALSEAELDRLKRISVAWLERRLDHVERTKEALTALAWSIGRRVSADLIDEGQSKEALWPIYEGVADVQHADIDRSLADGIARGFDPRPLLVDLRCALLPMTDFGLAERFLERYGEEFRFTTAKGWLGWDGWRWAVLDQDKDTLPAQLIAAVFETIRAVQREARRVAETGLKIELVTKGKQQELDLAEPNPHSLDHWVPVGKSWKRFSTLIAGWGRQCEQAGKPAAIANLARGTPGIERSRFMTVPIERFDCELMAINVLNGTLRLSPESRPDGTVKARVSLEPHRRGDLITRLAPVEYDREAPAPLYDAMIAWAQPEAAMRRYLHQVGGYAASGDTGEHKLWFNYGRGRNGKSTTIDSWCSSLGDYSGTIGIESFLDQGIKKRGDAATPDLARLGGVRMLRASEPERGAKLNSALIKAATGGEPMAVRALHRGFFDLLPRFKLLMSGNSRPEIPDTDEGIWSRMKLSPWLRNIDQPEPGVENWPKKDTKLLDKIKAGELPGVFARLVAGLIDYIEHGFVEPEGVTAATQAYREHSDPLARFLRLCTVVDPEAREKSSELHAVFAAWCKAAGEKEWSAKGFANAMTDKGFTKTRSDGMRWLGLRLVRSADEFVDDQGKVREKLPDMDDPFEKARMEHERGHAGDDGAPSQPDNGEDWLP